MTDDLEPLSSEVKGAKRRRTRRPTPVSPRLERRLAASIAALASSGAAGAAVTGRPRRASPSWSSPARIVGSLFTGGSRCVAAAGQLQPEAPPPSSGTRADARRRVSSLLRPCLRSRRAAGRSDCLPRRHWRRTLTRNLRPPSADALLARENQLLEAARSALWAHSPAEALQSARSHGA